MNRLATLLDRAGVGISEIDPRTRHFVRVNAKFCEIVGYPSEALIGRSSDWITHPDDIASTQALRTRLSDGSVPLASIEKRYIRPDGGVVWARVTVSGGAEEGQPLLGVVEDITERRRAEAALRESENQLRAIFDAAPIGIARVDLRTFRFLRVNERLCAITGYSAEELCGMSIAELTHPDDQATDRERVARSAAGQLDSGRVEKRYLRKDGTVVWVVVNFRSVPDEDGNPFHTIATMEDDTERRRAAEAAAASAAALCTSEDRYRTLVDNLDELVFAVDAEGVFTFVTPSIARFGYAADDVVGRPLTDFVHPEDRSVARTYLAARLARETGGPCELRWLDSSGRSRILRTTTRPALAGESVIGLTGLATDITAHRETEDQLRAAQRMEAIGRLAGGVAHDFNNILSVILSYTELAVEDLRAEDPLRADLLEVREAGKRAEGLTRQLLAFSRKQVLLPERVDIGGLVEGLGKMLRRLIGEDVALHVAAAPALYATKVDRGQIEQVVMNLAVNARDAMADGGELYIDSANVTLDASAAAALDVQPGDYVELRVRDTGCGMPAAVAARIFEPFFTTKGPGKGTGLGLSMVHGIVKQSGGGVAVETVPDRGTTFRILLPRHIGEVQAGVSRAAPAGPSRGSETILVVEDEAALRAVVKRVLTSAGYRVHTAANAGEALLLCEEIGKGVALVLTDVIMPGLNGRLLVERLKPLCPSAKVIFMSGYTDEALEQHGVLGQNFLRKPFERETLCTRVRLVLDGA